VRGRVSAIACLALAGCGGGADQGVTLPKGEPKEGGGFTYRGSTSQRERLTVEADGKALAKFRIRLGCKDGGSTVAAIATLPHRPVLQPDGSFYYSETGNTKFSGFGAGRYRVAMAGQLQGANGAGHASFRISFKSTTCRAAVSWQARRT
jgi:hypothetical protein